MIMADEDYISLVKYIMSNEEFQKLKDIEHHGTTRYEHSLRVSYFSYKIAKLLHLDYEATATSGLLHDFFLSDENRTKKDRFLSTFTHPKYALMTAEKHYDLTEKEKNIIYAHMFPIYFSLPKYAESWIVSLVDKIIGAYEFSMKIQYKFSYVTNLFVLLLIRTFK